MHRLLAFIFLTGPVFISSVTLLGCDARSEIVGTVRQEVELQLAAVPKPGRATLMLNIPFRKIEAGFNLYEFTFKSSGLLGGVVSYDTVLTLGQISLGRSPDAPSSVRVTAPFTLKGTFSGFDLEESGAAVIDVAFVVKSDWCPLLQIGATSVSLKDKLRSAELKPANRPISDFVATTILKQELQKAFECAKLRTGIAEMWRSDYFTILAGSKRLVMNLDPQSVRLSRFIIGRDAVRLTGLVEMIAAIGVSAQQLPRKLPSPGNLPLSGDTRISSEIEFTLSLSPQVGKK